MDEPRGPRHGARGRPARRRRLAGGGHAVPDRLDHQALHQHGDPAAPGRGQASPRRSPRRLPALVPHRGDARRRAGHHDPRAPDAHRRAAPRGRHAVLDGSGFSDRRGKPYADYVGEHILSPLGMKRKFVTTQPADIPGLATGYTRRLPSKPRRPAPLTDGRGITAAADMTTCVSDADDGTPTMVVDKAYQWVAPA